MTTRRHEDPAQHWRDRARQALKRIKHNREYALDSLGELGLASFLKGFKDRKGTLSDESDLVEAVERLARHLPGLTQARPAATEDAFEIEWPVDQLSGQRAASPWEKGQENVSLMNLITQRFPKLAAHMRSLATDPAYVWKRTIDKLDIEARRKEIEAIMANYKHEENPWRGGVENVAEQNEFVQTHSALDVEVYQDEAQPIRLPFQRATWNLTAINKLHRLDNELYHVAMAAQKIEREWNAVYLAQAEEDGKAAKAAEAEAKSRLGELSRV